MQMAQKIVGTYRLGHQMIQVVLRGGTGGEVCVLPGDIPYPRMEIGADQTHWGDIVAVAVHEATEHTAAVLLYRWEPTNDGSRDRAAVLFVMSHGQFSGVCDCVGGFLSDCLPDLAAAWEQWQKDKKTNARKSRKK